MNRTDEHIAAVLRTLDPADRHVPAPRTDLDAIVASPVGTGRPPRRPRATRLALAAGLTAAVAGGFVLWPSPTGGDTAFATWTAVPDDLSEDERAAAAESCRNTTRRAVDAATVDAATVDAAAVAVAERRGVWTTVVLAGEGGFSATCQTDDSGGSFGNAVFGSAGYAVGADDVGPRELLATDLGTGQIGDAWVSAAIGAAGAEVTGVVYRSAAHGDVVATVSHGYFALWFPGDELDHVDPVEVEVTYADGTTGTQVLAL